MYTVIVENDISKWDDQTGLVYHFPSRYLKFLKSGTKVIYYKGRMTEKIFKDKRLSVDPHYFGVATVGKLTSDEEEKTYYAEIENFQLFKKALPFKHKEKPLEVIPASLETNYWRNGVRPISKDVYDKIIELADIDNRGTAYNDQTDHEFTTTIIEGGKKKIYTTVYERKKETRDLALRIHGYTCQVCDLNFKAFYGEWGEGYIHVHHKNPLHLNDKEVEVDIANDLAVVCANCHAMIHRRKNVLLSLEELRARIRHKKNQLT